MNIHVKSVVIVIFILLSLLLIFTSFCFSQSGHKNKTGNITGRVLDYNTKKPLFGTTVIIIDTDEKASTDKTGRYEFKNLPAGTYAIECSRIGYDSVIVDNVTVSEHQTKHLNISMKEKPVKINDIVVTSSSNLFLEGSPASQQSLDREELKTRPKIGEDIYRAVTRMAGVSSNDFSARFRVRGGEHNQVLVLLDGFELIEPFHLKEVDGGAISSIDMEAVGGVDMSAGGYPAQYGEYMSGIFNIRLKQRPRARNKITAGIDFLSVHTLGEGLFDNGKGAWLFSTRRGYFDLVTKLSDEYDDITPQYYDLLSRVRYDFSDAHHLSVYLMHAYDKLDFFSDEDEILTANSEYQNSYIWLNLQSSIRKNWRVQNIIAYCVMEQNKSGDAYDNDWGDLLYDIYDKSNYDSYTVKQDHSLVISDFLTIKTGFQFKQLEVNYDYKGIQENRYNDGDSYRDYIDTNYTVKVITGHTSSAYLSNRLDISSFLSTEFGLRYDNISYTGEELYSPRINILVIPRQNTSINMSWGYFYQPQKIYELDIPDYDTNFYTAERAEHWIVGFDHDFNNKVKLKIDGYIKNISDLKPDYRNWHTFIKLFPEARFDRIEFNINNITSSGLEFTLEKAKNSRFNWHVSYSLSSMKEDIHSNVYEGQEIPVNEELPGMFDQRHTIYVDIGYELPSTWGLNLSWEYHTGWPYTEVISKSNNLYSLVTDIGILMDKRYPDYHRLDFRINKLFHTSKGDIRLFLEIVNLYNRNNLYGYDYELERDKLGILYYVKEPLYYLQIMPSIGITWNCNF